MSLTPVKFGSEITRSEVLRDKYPESVYWNKQKQPYAVIPQKDCRRSVYLIMRDTDPVVVKNKIKESSGELQRCMGVINQDNRKFTLLEVERVDTATNKWVRTYRLVEADTKLFKSGGSLEYELSYSSKLRLKIKETKKVGVEAEKIDQAMKPAILAALPSIDQYVHNNSVTTTSMIRDGEQVFVGVGRKQIPLKLYNQVLERLFSEEHFFTPGSQWYRRYRNNFIDKWQKVINANKLPKNGAYCVCKSAENVTYITTHGIVVTVEVQSVDNGPIKKKATSSFLAYYYIPLDKHEKPIQIQTKGDEYLLDRLPLSQEEKAGVRQALLLAGIQAKVQAKARARIVA